MHGRLNRYARSSRGHVLQRGRHGAAFCHPSYDVGDDGGGLMPALHIDSTQRMYMQHQWLANVRRGEGGDVQSET